MTQTRVQIATELRGEILSVENDEGRKEANLNPEEIEDNYKIWKGVAKALKEEWEREQIVFNKMIKAYMGDVEADTFYEIAKEESKDIQSALKIIGEVI